MRRRGGDRRHRIHHHDGSLKRRRERLDALLEGVDASIQLVDVVEELTHHEAVMIRHPTLKRQNEILALVA
jgi:hypothetical protein